MRGCSLSASAVTIHWAGQAEDGRHVVLPQQSLGPWPASKLQTHASPFKTRELPSPPQWILDMLTDTFVGHTKVWICSFCISTVAPTPILGDAFQEPPPPPLWMPETVDNTKTYICYACSYDKVNLYLRHSNRVSEMPALPLLNFGTLVK